MQVGSEFFRFRASSQDAQLELGSQWALLTQNALHRVSLREAAGQLMLVVAWEGAEDESLKMKKSAARWGLSQLKLFHWFPAQLDNVFDRLSALEDKSSAIQ